MLEIVRHDRGDGDRLDAESNYFVAVTGKELDLAPPADLATDSFSPSMTERPGCRRFRATNDTPTLVLRSYLGAGLRFLGDAETVTTTLSRPDDDRTSVHVEWHTRPGEWTYVATTAQLAELTITFDRGGYYTVCFGA